MRRGDLLALLFGIAAAALVGEALLALVWPQRSDVTAGMFEPHPAAGYRLLPGYENEIRVAEYRTRVRIDAEGMRIPAADARATAAQQTDGAAAGCRSLLAIGDSFTFGVGVDAEEAFPLRLESMLAERTGEPWCARNGGVGGYGPLRSARLLASGQGAAAAPRILVHAVYVGNDLEDSDPETFLREPRIEGGRMIAGRRDVVARTRRWLRIHSHLFSFLRARLYGLYERTPLAARSQYLDPIALRDWPERIRETTWPACRGALREIAAWSAARDVRYLVVLVPTKVQVEESAWARYRRRWKLPEEAFDRDHPQRELRAFLDAEGIAAIDLLEGMRSAAANGEHLYYRVDNHWTRDGHRFAARAIAEAIAARGWLAPPEGASPSPAAAPLAPEAAAAHNLRPFVPAR